MRRKRIRRGGGRRKRKKKKRKEEDLRVPKTRSTVGAFNVCLMNLFVLKPAHISVPDPSHTHTTPQHYGVQSNGPNHIKHEN
jgi:hypothetical protein